MPSKPTSVALMAQDIRAVFDLVETVRADSRHPSEAQIASAQVALDELVTLARAYTMVAYVEKVNGYKLFA